MFDESVLKECDELIARYPEPRSALLPILHLIQREQGWVSAEAQAWAAGKLDIPAAQVKGVTTFYTMYNTKPVGRYLLQVCRTICCELRGSEEIKTHIQESLGIKSGETTDDGLFTLIEVECLGACGSAPVMMINEDYHENLSPERVDEIISACRAAGGEVRT